MKLYYSPGACSMATHIALLEVGQKFETVKVDLKAKKYDGGDYWKVNAKGYVPALELPSGEILTENVAILQWIAEQNPGANLAPKAGTMQRYRLIEWLSYITSEVHKAYGVFWAGYEAQEIKTRTTEKLMKNYTYIDRELGGRHFLLGEAFSVADAYLFTVTRWASHLKVDLSAFKNITTFMERVGARPNVQKALKAEGLQ